MSDQPDKDLRTYLRVAESWADDREDRTRRLLRIAWAIAIVASVIAIAEAVAIIVLTPLKTVVPYTLMVDRQTGFVQALAPLDDNMVAPDRALTRSFLAQYVIAREGFDIDSVQDDYRKVALWSTGLARNQYIAGIQASNPASPLASLPRRAVISVEVRGISSLGAGTSLVRFVTRRTDPGGRVQQDRPWQAVVTFRFSGVGMSAADRLVNPLGFQVMRYVRDAETVLETDKQLSSPAVVAQPRPAAVPNPQNRQRPVASDVVP